MSIIPNPERNGPQIRMLRGAEAGTAELFEQPSRSRFHAGHDAQIRADVIQPPFREKECTMLQKIYESLQKINSDYLSHGREMEELVLTSEKLNQDYEANM